MNNVVGAKIASANGIFPPVNFAINMVVERAKTAYGNILPRMIWNGVTGADSRIVKRRFTFSSIKLLVKKILINVIGMM